jgi:hypothetical protein
MISRRGFLGAALAVCLPARAQPASPLLVVYKSPACGCCGGWESHMRSSGFRVDSRPLDDVTPRKRALGVPEHLASCHTATVGGYVVEGHVPAADVRRLPGMPVGAPGMEQGAPQPYATLAFDARRSWIFARH